ncbi:uncharacterized protein LOC128237559 [Mya arenaria]|uniref:uncharacterized protein LOC128237559 n=1 Tax=Mya arenaria TaxID=6604 RepID=UPI0022E6A944|nr:uncharacterized protein LOC128237559 [Mya arenaria]
MVDTRLPFGASKSPMTFHRITQAVRVIMQQRGYQTLIVYLDDFLIVGNTFKECQQALHELMRLVRELGFQINYNKIEGPSQDLTFLGLVLDSVNMTIRIPETKIHETQLLLQTMLSSKKVTKRSIQQVVGKLNWLSSCIYGGRFHMRRLIDSANKLQYPSHRRRVTQDMKSDMLWWLEFMKAFNGTMKIIDDRSALSISIDACTTNVITEGELDKAAQFFYSNAYSDNTKRTYTSHKNSYINFCTQFGYPAIPASTQTLCRYAAFLSKSLKFNSIKQYLNIVRILHAEWNLPNPLSNNFILNCTLQGIRRHLGDATIRKKPITPAMLHHILAHLDLSKSRDSTVWAAVLCMFY